MNIVPTTRFNGVGWDKIYRDRYWKKEHFDAIGGHQQIFISGVCCFLEHLTYFLFLFSEIRLDSKLKKCCELCIILHPRSCICQQQEKKCRNFRFRSSSGYDSFFLLLQRTWRPCWRLSIPRARSRFRKPPTDGSTITRACPASTATAWWWARPARNSWSPT